MIVHYKVFKTFSCEHFEMFIHTSSSVKTGKLVEVTEGVWFAVCPKTSSTINQPFP